MLRTVLKSKIHRVAVTGCELHYVSACAIGEDLMEATDLVENNQIHICNINSGEHFVPHAR